MKPEEEEVEGVEVSSMDDDDDVQKVLPGGARVSVQSMGDKKDEAGGRDEDGEDEVRRGPPRRTSSRRERSPPRHRNSHDGTSLLKDKYSSHTKSPERKRSISPISLSPSPRTKRLKGTMAEKESERSSERNERKRDEKGVKERGTDGETIIERRERRNGRYEVDKEVNIERRERRNERYENDRDKGKERREKRNEWDGDDRVRGKGRREEGQRRNDRDESNEKSSRPRHGRSASPPDRLQRRSLSRSPELVADHRKRSFLLLEANNAKGDEQGFSYPSYDQSGYRDDEDDSMTKMKAAEKALEEKQKQQPSFELSGKLAAETNRVRGVTLLFNEPPEARKPDIRWRLYVFKSGEALNEPLYIHRQSCYLFGRERRVVDIPTDHPSCSKQHAVIQFRQVEKEKPDGMMKKQVRPYLMDLGSTNKTYLNDNAIEPQRYYELFEKDTVKFGNSSREYVLLHENSAG